MLAPREKVGLLLRRTGFGATPAEVEQWSAKGIAPTIDWLLQAPKAPEVVEPPAWKDTYDATKLIDIQAYWMHRMVSTRYPLIEKMTLFWHGHFTSSIHKTGITAMMLQQNELLRKHAVGSFPVLLQAIAKDAAMLHWLDGKNSTKRAPNENYAREVMELFTVGPGPYTEKDVKEGARAFTGWQVDKSGTVSFNPKNHDSGTKSFLGKTGSFSADDIATILAARPETGSFLAAKLWRFFVSPTPHGPTVKAMAEAYQTSSGQIGAMLRALFLSDAYYADESIGALIKSPAEFTSTAMRLLGLAITRETASACNRMGQTLFDPPNVAGWPGGPTWLGSTAMLARWNLGEGIKQAMGQKPNPTHMPRAATAADLVSAWLDRFSIVQPSAATRNSLLKLVGKMLPTEPRSSWELHRNLVRAIVASPEFQVN